MRTLLPLLLLIIGCGSRAVTTEEVETKELEREKSEEKKAYDKKHNALYGYPPDQYGNNADWESEIQLDEKLIEEDGAEDNRDAEKTEKDK